MDTTNKLHLLLDVTAHPPVLLCIHDLHEQAVVASELAWLVTASDLAWLVTGYREQQRNC